MTASKTVVEQMIDQLVLMYQESADVVSTLEKHVAALEAFEKKTGNWPRQHLGLAHYRHSLAETIAWREELRNTADNLRRNCASQTEMVERHFDC